MLCSCLLLFIAAEARPLGVVSSLVPQWGHDWCPWWDGPVAGRFISRQMWGVTIYHTIRHQWTPFCQGMNNISDFVYRLLSLQTFSSRHQSSTPLNNLKSHQLASGQITLSLYFQCLVSPCIQVAQLCVVTSPSKRHTRSHCAGHVKVCDNISRDNFNNRGGVCAGIPPNLI